MKKKHTNGNGYDPNAPLTRARLALSSIEETIQNLRGVRWTDDDAAAVQALMLLLETAKSQVDGLVRHLEDAPRA